MTSDRLPAAEPLHRPRVGVLVVAFNAASTVAATLARLPHGFVETVDHIMVCDDASSDDTYQVAADFKSRSTWPLTVVRHETNLGYGGNQKAGYEWAMTHGLDVVVLLHGDGQYAPEVIEEIVEPLVSGDADAVFGSRMMVRGAARKGGMPLYKYTGNRILTRFQNKLTGLDLSEWHSGYRAYRVSALAELPLASYSDGFDFDTEIILGLASARKSIVEVPIPTYYGDEICYVNGMAYAKDVTIDVARHWARERGFGGGNASAAPDRYDLKPVDGSHRVLLDWLEAAPRGRVLDVGCFDGRFASYVTAMGHHVVGVDKVEHAGVTDAVAEFVAADLNEPVPAGRGRRLRRDRRGRRARARGRAARPAPRARGAAGPRGRGPGLDPEHQPLVPPRQGDGRPVRLRPARPARPRPPALLHPPHDGADVRRVRPRGRRVATRRCADRLGRRQAVAPGVRGRRDRPPAQQGVAVDVRLPAPLPAASPPLTVSPGVVVSLGP